MKPTFMSSSGKDNSLMSHMKELSPAEKVCATVVGILSAAGLMTIIYPMLYHIFYRLMGIITELGRDNPNELMFAVIGFVSIYLHLMSKAIAGHLRDKAAITKIDPDNKVP